MKTSLSATMTAALFAPLQQATAAFDALYPGESDRRQPAHTVYGGAHLFRANSARKLGQLALGSLAAYAPNFSLFARAIGLRDAESLPRSQERIAILEAELERDVEAVRRSCPAAWRCYSLYQRVRHKLESEAVEDFRIDFEDGYGHRGDEEEDSCAVDAAREVARGMAENSLPPFIGIRIKPFSSQLYARSVRTLDLFLTTLAEATDGRLPSGFVVTLPKVVLCEQVSVLVELFELLESQTKIAPGSLRMEVMVETPQSIFGTEGKAALLALVAAARGRITGAHFGVYDYTASLSITADHQHMTHPACDLARSMMQIILAGTGIALSDGATNIMPVGPHRPTADRPLTTEQLLENRRQVHQAWRLHYQHVRHSLENAYYQGWDLHPAQLPTRYAALYAFFLEGFESASERLRAFVAKAAQATLVRDVFDDAATGQGLLNFFLRGLSCGAITEEEALGTGLTLAELKSRSFLQILEGRRNA